VTDRSVHILGSPGFLIGLSLLLSNDFVFKEQFHNGFTGKLSDFAGLFALTLFWIAFFPHRKTFICVATAVLFVFWKSSYSQFLIEGWNHLPFFGINRTVDYSDLSALLMLPLAYSYCKSSAGVYVSRKFIYAIAVVSVFAFTATQFSQKTPFNDQYQFKSSRKELLERISRLPRDGVSDSFWKENSFEITFDSCNDNANVSLEERGDQTIITLKQMEYRCPSKGNPQTMREYFEKEFIDKLHEEPISKSAQVLYISSSSPAASNTPSP
jgi:hypothetical protein